MVVLGAGTGFGVAGLARSDRGDVAIATEGGHAGLRPHRRGRGRGLAAAAAAATAGSPSSGCCPGPGLYDLYQALAEHRGRRPPTLADEKAVTEAGLAGDAAGRRRRWTGSAASWAAVAGDLALTFGARGGVYHLRRHRARASAERLAAGRLPRTGSRTRAGSPTTCAQIPTYLVAAPLPGDRRRGAASWSRWSACL